jgi:hypothetical protein
MALPPPERWLKSEYMALERVLHPPAVARLSQIRGPDARVFQFLAKCGP